MTSLLETPFLLSISVTSIAGTSFVFSLTSLRGDSFPMCRKLKAERRLPQIPRRDSELSLIHGRRGFG